MTVGMAVATTVDSIAARNTAPITPASTSPRCGCIRSSISGFQPSVAARAAGAPAQRAERGKRVDALVIVGPRDVKGFGPFLDVARPAHRLGQGRIGLAVPRGIVEAQPLEGIDARMVVGPRHADGVAADEVHVLGL